jgi:predicted alpha/beta-hydrolase family hydrolase
LAPANAVRELETPHGPARAHLTGDAGRGTLVLGHGAGGGVEAPDLLTARDIAVEAGLSVALVEQPYRVAGKRSQPAAAKLDEAWIAVIAELRSGEPDDLPLVVGGRSAGARIACRTAAECKAAAVLCLAFPVHPPGNPEKTRIAELDAVALPVLVVQGQSDPFGMPAPGENREVVKVAGDHGLKKDPEAVASAIGDWLPRVVG